MKILKTISIHLFVFIFLIVPVIVAGQATGNDDPPPPAPTTSLTPININIRNPLKCTGTPAECGSVMYLITVILNNVVMPIAAVAVVMWVIYAGFMYLTAQGNPAKIKEAHARLLWSLVGAGILLGAAGIAKVVEKTITAVIVPSQ